MNKGTFVLARAVDGNVWHYGLVKSKRSNGTMRLITMAEAGAVGPEIDCRPTGASGQRVTNSPPAAQPRARMQCCGACRAHTVLPGVAEGTSDKIW